MELVGFTELEKYFDAIYDRITRSERLGCGHARERLLELVLPYDEDEMADLTSVAGATSQEPEPDLTDPPDPPGLDYVEEFKRIYARSYNR